MPEPVKDEGLKPIQSPNDVKISFAPDSYKPLGSSPSQIADNAMAQAEDKFPFSLVSDSSGNRMKALENFTSGIGVALSDSAFGHGLKELVKPAVQVYQAGENATEYLGKNVGVPAVKGLGRSLIDSTVGTVGDLAFQWGSEAQAEARVTPQSRLEQMHSITEDLVSPKGLFQIAASGGVTNLLFNTAMKAAVETGQLAGAIAKGALAQNTDLDNYAHGVGASMRMGADDMIRNLGLDPKYDKFINKFSYDLGEGAGSVLTSIGIGLVSGGAGGAAYFGLIQKAQTSREMMTTANVLDTQTGQTHQVDFKEYRTNFEADLTGGYHDGQVSKDGRYKIVRAPMGAREAGAVGMLAAIPEAGLEFVGLHVILKGLRGYKPLQRIFLVAFEQALQEAGQQGSEELIAKRFWDREGSNSDIWKRIGYAAMLGLILGVPTGAISTMTLYKSAKGDLMAEMGLTEPQADAILENATRRIVHLSKEEAPKFVESTLSAYGLKFQVKPNELGLYSALRKAIIDKMPNSASPEQIRGILKQGVKQEEIEFVGIDKFLEGKDKVQKIDLLAFIDANEVHLETVVKGESDIILEPNEDQPEILQIYRADDPGGEHSGMVGEIITKAGAREMFEVNVPGVPRERFNTLEEAQAFVQKNTDFGAETKFQGYQVPGGSNYREILITVPAKKEKIEYLVEQRRDLGRQWVVRASNETLHFKSFETKHDAESAANLLNHNEESDYSAETFRAGHFEEPNVLVHVRANDRQTDLGKTLFLEEVQSDWHQKGRKEGYSSDINQISELPESAEFIEKGGHYFVLIPEISRQYMGDGITKSLAAQDAIRTINDMRKAKQSMAVPNAPFKKTWHELALKAMLQHAIDGGYDALAWTTGEQQAQRYDLSKQVEDVRIRKREDGTYSVAVTKKNESGITMIKEVAQESELPDLIGKDLAKKAVEQNAGKVIKYEGGDLKVGGEGMKGFYDQIIPAFLNKYAKKWGGKVGQILMGGESERDKMIKKYTDLASQHSKTMTWQEAAKMYGENPSAWSKKVTASSIHALAITPEMKESIKTEGQPMFQKNSSEDTILKEEAIAQWNKLKDKIPHQYHAVFADMISNNFHAFADLAQKILLFTQDLKKNTVPHEVFHVIYGELLTAEEKTALAEEVKWNSGLTDPVEVEEFLSDRFSEAWLGRESRIARIGGHIYQFIHDTVQLLRSILQVKDVFEDIFDTITKKSFEIRKQSQKLAESESPDVSKLTTDEALAISRKFGVNMGIVQNLLRGKITPGQHMAILDKLDDTQLSQFYRMRDEAMVRLEGLRMQKRNQVDTPEFKAWFGKSKVVDESGKPLVVYHGTGAEFDAFSHDFMGERGTSEGKGFYFTNNKQIANGYKPEGGRVIKAYLSIEKPLSSESKSITKEQLSKFIKGIDEDGQGYLSNWGDVSYEGYESVLKKAVEAEYDGSENDLDMITSIVNATGGDYERNYSILKATLGYDGAIAENPWGGKQTVYVPFLPTQIKSATENSGAFSSSNPNIRFQEKNEAADKDAVAGKVFRGEEVSPEELAQYPDLAGVKPAVDYVQREIKRLKAEGTEIPDILNQQSESLMRMFGYDPEFINKKSPSPERLLGQPEEQTVEMGEKELLKKRLQDEARGSRYGYRAGQIAARRKLKAAMTDKLEDIQAMKSAIIEYAAENLPKAERGELLTMVRDADSLNDIFKAAERIDKMAEEVQKKQLISAIKRHVVQIANAKNMAVEYKDIAMKLIAGIDLVKHRADTLTQLQKTRDFINAEIAAGRDVTLPQYVYDSLSSLNQKPATEMTVDELEAIADKLELVKNLAKQRLASRKAAYEAEKELILRQLETGTDNKIVTKQDPQRKIEAPNFGDKIRDAWRGSVNYSQLLDKARQPMDHLFQSLGDAYHDAFKRGLDLPYGEFLSRFQKLKNDSNKLVEKLDLDETSMNRIGVYGAMQQEGGREKLITSGFTEAQIDAVKLNPKEQQYYDYMRAQMDAVFPEFQQVVRLVYNEEVRKVNNYFPFMTDFSQMSDLEVRQRLMELPEFQSASKKNVNLSASKKRVDTKGAATVRIDAHNVFLNHMENVLYAIHMAKGIKMLQEIAKNDRFEAAAGDLGQRLTVEWLDLMARKGGSANDQARKVLDFIRKNSSLAMLTLNPSSIAVQITPMIDAAGFIGSYAFTGQTMMASKAWRNFVMDNSPELKNRVGDDSAFREFGKSWFDKIREAGMTPQRAVDGQVATGVFIGAYQKFMDDEKLPIDLSKPNKEAILYAERVVRETQSSALFKDLPLFISKGIGAGDSKSWGKAWSQFQTPLFYRFANLRETAVRKAKQGDYHEAANIIGTQVAATLAEFAIRYGVKSLAAVMAAAVMGTKAPDDDKTIGQHIVEILQSFAGNIPFVSNAVSLFAYKQAPVTALAIAGKALEDYRYFSMAKRADTIMKWAQILALDLLALGTGLPTPRITYLLKKKKVGGGGSGRSMRMTRKRKT